MDATYENTVKFRPIQPYDQNYLFWFRNTECSSFSILKPYPISYEEHDVWFQNQFTNPKQQSYIIEINGSIAGLAEFTWLKPDQNEIYFGIEERWRGKGFENLILKICDELSV